MIFIASFDFKLVLQGIDTMETSRRKKDSEEYKRGMESKKLYGI